MKKILFTLTASPGERRKNNESVKIVNKHIKNKKISKFRLANVFQKKLIVKQTKINSVLDSLHCFNCVNLL